MRIYFSGLGGVGIGPAALLAKDLGHDVLGSDIHESENLDRIRSAGIDVQIDRTGSKLKESHERRSIDWFVHTPALTEDNPQLIYAKQAGIKTSKRYEFINQFTKEHDLKTIACSGSHGKTTTTAMMSWVFNQFKIPAAYTIGTNISWGPYGKYEQGAEFYIDEADEFDKKFLNFHPEVSIITKVDFDHADSYPTTGEYKQAFRQFIAQSAQVYMWSEDVEYLEIENDKQTNLHIYDAKKVDLSDLKLPGEHNRRNAFLVAKAFPSLYPEYSLDVTGKLNQFPGTQRRFEKLADNIYTDYAHHPVEIKATLQLAREVNKNIVVVYQPHQNLRQHHLLEQGGYGDCFAKASQVYWLPTYMVREDPGIDEIPPEQIIKSTTAQPNINVTELNDELWRTIRSHAAGGKLVLLMSAGDLDDWARKKALGD